MRSEGAAIKPEREQADDIGVYEALGIAKHEIERGRPWQNFIETHFNVQRGMADWHFARAESWAELVLAHERFVGDYNAQAHFAHSSRDDGRRSPAEVLAQRRLFALDALGEGGWLKALRLEGYAPRAPRILPQIGSGEGVRFRVCSASGVLVHHGERCGRWSDSRRRPSTKAGRNRRMANETPGGQDPKFERRVVRWLLDSDPSIRWQVMRDLAEDPDEPVAAQRMTGMRARAAAGFAFVRAGSLPRIYLSADASPSVPQYHRRQTLGRESGDGRPERASTALELVESRAIPAG